MKKMNNVFKNMKADFVAAYNESKTRYDSKFEATAAKAEEIGYDVFKAVYAPSYGVGYAVDAVANNKAIKKASNIVSNIVSDVKFSAAEGYANGKEAHMNAIAQKSQEVQVAQFREALEEVASTVAQQGAEDEQYAVYYEGNDAICGDGIWTGVTAF